MAQTGMTPSEELSHLQRRIDMLETEKKATSETIDMLETKVHKVKERQTVKKAMSEIASLEIQLNKEDADTLANADGVEEAQANASVNSAGGAEARTEAQESKDNAALNPAIGVSQLPQSCLDGGPEIYKCVIGVLFVKRSEDPTIQRITKVYRHMGSRVFCTGCIWTGPSGGRWAEVDCRREKGDIFGWVLVEGPGFGLKGPALLDATANDLVKIEVLHLGAPQGIIWRKLVDKAVTIGEIKKHLQRDVGLTSHHCCIGKDAPGVIPGSDLRLGADYMQELQDHRTLKSCNFEQETATLLLVFVGDLPENFKAEWVPLPST